MLRTGVTRANETKTSPNIKKNQFKIRYRSNCSRDYTTTHFYMCGSEFTKTAEKHGETDPKGLYGRFGPFTRYDLQTRKR